MIDYTTPEEVARLEAAGWVRTAQHPNLWKWGRAGEYDFLVILRRKNDWKYNWMGYANLADVRTAVLKSLSREEGKVRKQAEWIKAQREDIARLWEETR